MSIAENNTIKRAKKKVIIPELDKEEKTINKKLSAKSKNNSEAKFSKIVFERLPELFKIGCNTLVDEIEKEVFLMGSIGLISGILPNVQASYDGQIVYPNLYVAVLGKFGTGKGALRYAKLLLDKVNISLLNQDKFLFIPANNSKTGVVELLDSNDERGIIFETEASTLATAMKTEHGKFKDILLRAFHHEFCSFYRSTENRSVMVKEPKLSCVLSSTPGQFKDFIPTMEDGLFSRFIYYYTSGGSVDFRNVFDPKKGAYIDTFKSLSKEFYHIYSHLLSLDKPIQITLKKGNQKKFISWFDNWTKFFYKINSELAGVGFRIALITYRIMIIFTIIRFFESKAGEKEIKMEGIDSLEIQEIDFKNALEITEVLISGSLEMYEKMPEKRKKESIEKKENIDKDKRKKELIENVKELLKEGLTPLQIQLKLRIAKSTYFRLRNIIKKEEKEGVNKKT